MRQNTKTPPAGGLPAETNMNHDDKSRMTMAFNVMGKENFELVTRALERSATQGPRLQLLIEACQIIELYRLSHPSSIADEFLPKAKELIWQALINGELRAY
jgi:hypothetical protein